MCGVTQLLICVVWHKSSYVWCDTTPHMCDVTQLLICVVWHNSSYVWCDTTPHMCGVTQLFICVVWHNSSYVWCDTTPPCIARNYSYVCHVSFICLSWLIRTCAMTHSCVGHDPSIYVLWLIHVCAMTQPHVWGPYGKDMRYEPSTCSLETWWINMMNSLVSHDCCLNNILYGPTTWWRIDRLLSHTYSVSTCDLELRDMMNSLVSHYSWPTDIPYQVTTCSFMIWWIVWSLTTISSHTLCINLRLGALRHDAWSRLSCVDA